MAVHQQHIRRLLAVAALLATAGTAQAQAVGYALVGGGRSSFDVDCSGTSSCDKSGNALQLIGGYRFPSGWAVEGLYANLGKAKAIDSGVNIEVKATALGAGGAYIADLAPNWNATVRLGLASVKLKASARLGSIVDSNSESKTDLYTGLGVGYQVSKGFGAELGFLRTRGEIEGDKGTITAITLSARFTF